MPTQYIRRGSGLAPNQSNKSNANTVRVDSDTDTLKFGTGATGTTEKEVADLSSTQTLTGKTLTSPVINAPTGKRKVTVYADDGAIAKESHVAVLTKGSAGAYTLAAPVAGTDDGIEITIVAGTSFAHVVTGTNLFWAGETGGPFNKVTTAAFIGSAATVVAYNGIWHVVSDQIATVGD